MKAEHLEILVEELSMEAYLAALLPRILGDRATFAIYAHQGKDNLLRALNKRLVGYSKWLPPTSRIVILMDRDDDQCDVLKARVERMTRDAGLATRTAAQGLAWQVVSRIVIEELEAWYFGDWEAVKSAFPRVAAGIPGAARYRQPDAIQGGTWEAFERILQKAGYFRGGLEKIKAARAIGTVTDPEHNDSPSFRCFRNAVLEAVS